MTPALPADESALRAFLEASPSAVFVIDPAGRIDYANHVAAEIFGYAVAEMLGQPVETLLPPDGIPAHLLQRERFLARPTSKFLGRRRQDFDARRKDGSVFPVETTLVSVVSQGRALVVVSANDITERREAESALREISRCYLTLCQMNPAIARATDAPTLFAQTCQIAVEQGGYLGAWVAQPGEGHLVVQAASAGALDDYVEQLGVNADPDDPRGRGPTGLVLREGRSYYSEQFDSDVATLPWRALAAEYGVEATATLPIRLGGEVVATLTLYSDKPGVFSQEVRALLEAMADNVTFALNSLDTLDRLHAVARERTDLSRRLVAAQEEERARIAAAVHDDAVQSLAALDLRLGLLKRQLTASGTRPPRASASCIGRSPSSPQTCGTCCSSSSPPTRTKGSASCSRRLRPASWPTATAAGQAPATWTSGTERRPCRRPAGGRRCGSARRLSSTSASTQVPATSSSTSSSAPTGCASRSPTTARGSPSGRSPPSPVTAAWPPWSTERRCPAAGAASPATSAAPSCASGCPTPAPRTRGARPGSPDLVYHPDRKPGPSSALVCATDSDQLPAGAAASGHTAATDLGRTGGTAAPPVRVPGGPVSDRSR